MPLFYFDAWAGGKLIEDDEGTDLPDLAAAGHEATNAAREQIANAAGQGLDVTNRRFDIRDVNRQLVFEVHFSETLRRP